MCEESGVELLGIGPFSVSWPLSSAQSGLLYGWEMFKERMEEE